MADEKLSPEELAEFKRLVNVHRQSESDVEAIIATAAVLNLMAVHAERLSGDGLKILGSAKRQAPQGSYRPEVFAEGLVTDVASTLKNVRAKLAEALEELGEFFNGRDACSDTLIEISRPVFELLRKREQGVATDA